MQNDFKGLTDALVEFRDARDWAKFQSPKNLSMALAVEVAEIQEIFQWLSEADSESLLEDKRQHLADELADVLAYLLLLAQRVEVDLPQALVDKMAKNAIKYPVDKVRGSAKKYNEYE